MKTFRIRHPRKKRKLQAAEGRMYKGKWRILKKRGRKDRKKPRTCRKTRGESGVEGSARTWGGSAI